MGIRQTIGRNKFIARNYMFFKDYIFTFPKAKSLSFWDKWRFQQTMKSIDRQTNRGDRPHRPSHIYSFTDAIFDLSPDVKGCIVEAGCFKGISTAKFSHVAKKTNRKLVVFDSFEGLPENDEQHIRSILGHSIEGWFVKGKFAGAFEEVQHNISRFGYLDVCEFKKGWFDQTMPQFKEPIAAAYIDVDLASSTKTCLKYLYPLLSPGGVLVSQDGDFPLVLDVYQDVDFWRNEVGYEKPYIEGIGTKMLKIVKPIQTTLH